MNDLELFLRYATADKVFELRIGDTHEVAARFPEDKISDLEKVIAQDKTGKGKAEIEIFKFLVDAAKKDPGKWVSASSRKVKKGQAVVGS